MAPTFSFLFTVSQEAPEGMHTTKTRSQAWERKSQETEVNSNRAIGNVDKLFRTRHQNNYDCHPQGNKKQD